MTIKVVDCPANRVIGGVRPLVLKPGPETWTWEMLTLELPELVSVTVCVLVPTATSPKLRLVGLVVSCKVAATPVPLRARVVGELGASLTSDRLPVTLPGFEGTKATLKLVVSPAPRVSGMLSPVIVRLCPETVACEMVKLAVPRLISVIVCVLVVPTTALPKLTLAGVTESRGCTPVPLRAVVLGELGASLTSERLPDTLPVVVGANCTLRVLDCPGGRVIGKVSPLMVKPTPVALPCTMVKLAEPELVKVRFCRPVLPMSTLPKLALGGVTKSCGCTPVPLRATVLGEMGALLSSERLPDTLPVAVGANCTLSVLDCPGGRVSGKVNPLMVKLAPVALACAMVRLAVPELVKVRFCRPVLPTSTLPRLMLGGVTES